MSSGTVTWTCANGETVTAEVEHGMTLMEAAVRNDVPGIIAECGGAASCATCHVIMDDERADKVPPRSDIEDDMLDFAESERQPNSRLSCQLVMSRDLNGVRLIVPQGCR